MYRIIILLSLTVLLSLVQACAQKGPYVSDKGRFSINLRVTPEEDKNSAEASLGGKKLWWRTQRASFMVSYVDKPDAKKEDAMATVEASADGYITAIPKAAQVVGRKTIAIGGHPGIEVQSREKDGYTAVTRYYMVEKRLYCVMALWTAGPDDGDVLQTLDSFKVNPPASTN